VSCAELSREEYTFMQKTEMLHWFCKHCERPAMSAVKNDRLIEEKCGQMLVAFRIEMEENFTKHFNYLKDKLAQVKAQVKDLT
jgi:hypothetical protein